jgi:hypothetical protein
LNLYRSLYEEKDKIPEIVYMKYRKSFEYPDDEDWNEIKEKISSEPNKYLLIKKPFQGHNFQYYFSVLKHK